MLHAKGLCSHHMPVLSLVACLGDSVIPAFGMQHSSSRTNHVLHSGGCVVQFSAEPWGRWNTFPCVVVSPGAQPYVIDVSQQAGRCEAVYGHVPCVTPSCQHLHSKRLRLLLGQECLRLQGIVYGEDDKLQSFTNEALTNLAGNAFQTHCCTAAFLVGLATYDVLRGRRQNGPGGPFDLEFGGA